MDSSTLNYYQTCIKNLLSEYGDLNTPETRIEMLFDDYHSHYMVMRIGWYGQKRIHICLIHISIEEDEIVIQANNTEDELDNALIACGIPKDKISLGILPPEIRKAIAQRHAA
ncbi:XisI protein [Thiofilum flexile]|uniref:XisI protein n=1 Tax=Thiofilum flexile TaxID=125627 RepID=UPI0003613CAD|nr:XisI protein [Thiofilum flexile]